MVTFDHWDVRLKLGTRLLRHRVPLATVALCLLLLCCRSPALAQEGDLFKPLVASGTSPMLGEDSADARNLALNEALRSAVEQALGSLLPAERIVRFYPILLDRVLAEPKGYVQDYQIIHEGTWNRVYRVTVQTTLFAQGLRRDLRRLGLFLATRERPRVLILVAERTEPQGSWSWWWQKDASADQEFAFSLELAKLFSARGLMPLDLRLLEEKFPADQSYQAPMLDDAQGAAIAMALGTQVVVLGQVSHLPASSGTLDMASGMLRALEADSGKVLSRVSASVQLQPADQEPVASQTFAALAERMTPSLVDGILTPFTEVSEAPRGVTIRVQGVSDYGDLVIIKEYLQRAPGVREIKQIRLQGDMGSVVLIFAGSLDALKSSLASRDFGYFITEAELAGDNLVTLTIVSKR